MDISDKRKASVAQMVEPLPFKHQDAASNAVASTKIGETLCIHGSNRPLECKQCQWAYGSGPQSLAGNTDL